MPITVQRQRGERRIVVVVTGAVDAEAVPTLRRTLVRALRTRAPILIDLTQATSINRAGLTVLVAAHRQAERTRTSLLLRTGPSQIRSVVAAFGIPPEPH